MAKDVFYNIEIVIGESKYFELSLDLMSPWSWVKGSD